MAISHINEVAVDTASIIYGLTGLGKVNGSNLRSSFTPNTALFNGTTNYINKASSITGVADGPAFTLSTWVKFQGGDGAIQTLLYLGQSTAGLNITRLATTGLFRISARASTTATLMDASSSIARFAADPWFHLYMCVSLPGTHKIYFNGIEDTSVNWGTPASGNIDMSQGTTNRIAAGVGPANYLNGALSEFWFDDSYLDNPAAFIENGVPKNLGLNGELPTGTSPALYLSRNGSGSSWAVDSSTNANALTVVGAALGTLAPPTN